MGFSVGIVGLPNVGKSTLFNALTQSKHAQVANYPFCTIEPNHAVVKVPDENLEHLSALIKPKQTIHATIDFVDIAGLVKGSHKGEGLGNQFLSHIRETDALVHIVRCFEDENIVHINGKVNPIEDIEIINIELVFADLQQLERKIEKLHKNIKGDKKLQPLLELCERLKQHFEKGFPARTFAERDSELFQELNEEMRFTTGKKIIYVANVDEKGLEHEPPVINEIRQLAEKEGTEVVKVCAQLEMDLAEMSEEERKELLAMDGAMESALEQVVHAGYRLLNLVTFYTMAPPKEIRAWAIKEGTHVVKAAGMIHTDFEKHFVCAEVIPVKEFLAHGSEAGARQAGAWRIEGKDYIVKDGDCIYIKANA
ncbi:MAG TPA: redox-regulated ATPase YchF [Candidatus Hydrogenedens sp.]|nr:redox-regulated ATPase YchF [Candidatus Hydrogenedens sp.]